jgi:hypothetical protein
MCTCVRVCVCVCVTESVSFWFFSVGVFLSGLVCMFACICVCSRDCILVFESVFMFVRIALKPFVVSSEEECSLNPMTS